MKVGSQKAKVKDEQVGTAEMGDGRKHRAVGEKEMQQDTVGRRSTPGKVRACRACSKAYGGSCQPQTESEARVAGDDMTPELINEVRSRCREEIGQVMG